MYEGCRRAGNERGQEPLFAAGSIIMCELMQYLLPPLKWHSKFYFNRALGNPLHTHLTYIERWISLALL